VILINASDSVIICATLELFEDYNSLKLSGKTVKQVLSEDSIAFSYPYKSFVGQKITNQFKFMP
jgi:hypothetical protein